MGAFYTSHTLRGPSQPEVLAWLGSRPAFVSQSERSLITVLDEECESQDGEVFARLASELSAHLSCPVLAVLNHDDDILYFELYREGRKLDEYNSNPGYFGDGVEADTPSGGNALVLCAVFDAPDASVVETALRSGDFVFATERHKALFEALGLPIHSVGLGYNYVHEGDVPPGAADGNYVHSAA